MSYSRPYLRALSIAFVAMVGIFSATGEASACDTAPRSCCAGKPTKSCGCCGETGEPAPANVMDRIASPLGTRVQSPERNCECRSQDPAAPNSKHESQTSEQRNDEARSEGLVVFETHLAQIRPSRFTARPLSPPATPLYLRDSRLNI